MSLRKRKLARVTVQINNQELLHRLYAHHNKVGLPGTLQNTISDLVAVALDVGETKKVLIHQAMVRAYNRTTSALHRRIAEDLARTLKELLVTVRSESASVANKLELEELDSLHEGLGTIVTDTGVEYRAVIAEDAVIQPDMIVRDESPAARAEVESEDESGTEEQPLE